MNFCLLGYGQTSSGKSYTMIGERENPGLIPRFLADLFAKGVDLREEADLQLHYSFFEIYKEKIFDCMQVGEKPLSIREFTGSEVIIEGLTRKKAESLTEVFADLGAAVARRRAGETLLNSRSSRSHFVASFEVRLTSEVTSEKNHCEVIKRSKLIFVDLAGSEKYTSSEKESLAEGCAINRSLSVLAHVVNSLSRRSPSFLHFRDSKLTHFLKDCFTGNAHIAIVANVLAHKEYLAETHSTLSFLSAAQRVRTDPHLNVETHSSHSASLDKLTKDCAKILEELTKLSQTEDSSIISHLQSLYQTHISNYPNPLLTSEYLESVSSLSSIALSSLPRLRTLLDQRLSASMTSLASAFNSLSISISKLEEPRSFLSESPTYPSMNFPLTHPTRTLTFSESNLSNSRMCVQRISMEADFRRLELLKKELEKQREKQVEELRKIAEEKRKYSCDKTAERGASLSCSCGEKTKTSPVYVSSSAAGVKKIADLERQLRNRNKDYLYALKEIEKLKLTSSAFQISNDRDRSMIE